MRNSKDKFIGYIIQLKINYSHRILVFISVCFFNTYSSDNAGGGNAGEPPGPDASP